MAVVSNVGWARVLCEPLDLHSRVEEKGNIAREGGVNAVTDSAVDGSLGALVAGGGCKNEHVEV